MGAGIRDWQTRTDEEIVWGMNEMAVAIQEQYKGQKPWVAYYNNQLENGTLISKTDMKMVYEFVVDERAAKTFYREHLKVGDVIRIEIEFTDQFQDDIYVSGFKVANEKQS